MGRRYTLTVLLLLLISGAAFDEGAPIPRDVTTAIPDELLGRWEELPLPPAEHPYISDMVMEPGGMVWIIANNGLYYWSGESFRPPVSGEFSSGQYLTGLYGGPDRGAYATQRGEKDHWGKLYRLSDGEARYVTDFYYGESGRDPGLYVSESGKLYIWGDRFLAVYTNGEWRRIEARLSREGTSALDTGSTVYFYYNGKLCSADTDDNLAEHNLPAPIEAVPGQRRGNGALLGDDKIILLDYSQPGICIYNLKSLRPIPTHDINAVLGEQRLFDLFRAGDGAVWILAHSWELPRYILYRISPSGEVTPIKESVEVSWNNTRFRHYPHSVLNASDGSVWFGLTTGQVAHYRDGELRVFGWRDGLTVGRANNLFETPQGDIWAASSQAIYIFQIGEPPGKLPANLRLWEEYRLASYHPIRDSAGNIWLFLKERLGEVSRWDGREWHHRPVPFDTAHVSRAMADDRGHILVGAHPDGCFDISPNSITRYENLESMLVAVVAHGATRFAFGREFQGCYVLPGGRIWYGYHNSKRFHYFDGERWDEFHMRDNVWYMYESPKYDILVRTQGNKYYTYDRGQILEIECPRDTTRRWVLGPKHLQPFEQALLELHPELYTAVERGEGGRYYVLYPSPREGAGESYEPSYVMGDRLPLGLKTVTPGYFGGYWTESSGLGQPYRIFAGKVFQCNFKPSPLAGREKNITLVLEDRAHGLWVYAGLVFHKRLDDFSLHVEGLPTEAKRSVYLTAEPLLPGLNAHELRLFWRFADSPWRGGHRGNSTTIRFPSSGRYKIELMGMDALGGTSEVLTFALDATVPLPDTKLVQEGPYNVRDVVWVAPVELMPSEPGIAVQLAYRVDEGPWEVVGEGKTIPMGGREPGNHVVEIAAQEAKEYRDPTPVRLDVEYVPDFEFIVNTRLGTIIGGDAEQVQTALSEIETAGPAVIPFLTQKLLEVRKTAKLIEPLERLLRDLKHEKSNM